MTSRNYKVFDANKLRRKLESIGTLRQAFSGLLLRGVWSHQRGTELLIYICKHELDC